MVLRHIVRQWLGSLAQEKVHQTIVQAARDSVASAVEEAERDSTEPERRKSDVGVVFALRIEAGGLEDLLSEVVTVRGPLFTLRRGLAGSRRIVLAESGPGAAAAARAAETLIAAHQPDWLISAGFAGALNEDVKRHDLLLADSVIRPDGARIAIHLPIDPANLPGCPNVHVGGLCTADRIIRLPDEKRKLGEESAALAVDMETFAVAEVCRRRNLPLIAARIISDAVGDQLPDDLEQLARQQTPVRKLGAVFGAVLNRPASVKDMLQLKENALLASDRLAGLLQSIIRQLTAPPPP
ncbi:MAG: hypothetical protein PHN77_05525 [Thermoguttaceae bacterium]|nr:hypothetical protein [Thermoguttaceae bacterium]